MAVKAKCRDAKGFESDVDMYARIDLESFNHGAGHAGIQVGWYNDEEESKKLEDPDDAESDLIPNLDTRKYMKLYPANRAQCKALREMNVKQRYAWLNDQDENLAAGTEA